MDRDKHALKLFGSRISLIFSQNTALADGRSRLNSPASALVAGDTRSSRTADQRTSGPKMGPVTPKQNKNGRLAVDRSVLATRSALGILPSPKISPDTAKSRNLTTPSSGSSMAMLRPLDAIPFELSPPKSHPVSRKKPPASTEKYLLSKETSFRDQSILPPLKSEPNFNRKITSDINPKRTTNDSKLDKVASDGKGDASNSVSDLRMSLDSGLNLQSPVDRLKCRLSNDGISTATPSPEFHLASGSSNFSSPDKRLDEFPEEEFSEPALLFDPFKSHSNEIQSSDKDEPSSDTIYAFYNYSLSASLLEKDDSVTQTLNRHPTSTSGTQKLFAPSVSLAQLQQQTQNLGTALLLGHPPYPINSGLLTPMNGTQSPVSVALPWAAHDRGEPISDPFQGTSVMGAVSRDLFETTDSLSIITPVRSNVDIRKGETSRTNSTTFRTTSATIGSAVGGLGASFMSSNSAGNSFNGSRNLHTKTGSISLNLSSGSYKNVNLAALKKTFNLHAGEGERSAYVVALRRAAGTTYNDLPPGKWKLPIGVLPVDKHATTNAMYLRSAGAQSRMKKNQSGVELKHGHLAPRLLAAEVDDENDNMIPGMDSRLGGGLNSTPTLALTNAFLHTMGSSRADLMLSKTTLSAVLLVHPVVSPLRLQNTQQDMQSIATNGTEPSQRTRLTLLASDLLLLGSISDTNVRFYQHPVYQYDEEDDDDGDGDEDVYERYEAEERPTLKLANPDSDSD